MAHPITSTFILFLVKSKPTPKDLQRCVTPQYATSWREIGIQLDLTNEALSIIQEDYPLAKRRCNEMLMKWLEVDTNASWQKLLDAIDECTEQYNVQGNVLKWCSSLYNH